MLGKIRRWFLKGREYKYSTFSNPYKVNVQAVGRYELILGRERMEEVKEFKHLGN